MAAKKHKGNGVAHDDTDVAQSQEIDIDQTELERESHEACQREIADLKQQCEEKETKYRRVLADYQNLERQTQDDRARFAKLATELFVQQLIVPFDHLLMAAKHINDKGLELVIKQFSQLFESQGLKELEVLGKPFDATTMEAIDTRDGEIDKVLEVIQPGYELNGIVIRPAKVIVGKGN